MKQYINDLSSVDHLDLDLKKYVAIEKLSYMHQFAKSSTVATILAPLLCIPLYALNAESFEVYYWFAFMTAAVILRIVLIQSIKQTNLKQDFNKLDIGVGIVTFAWGIGWLILVPDTDPANYLIYQIICLTILFVGMVGYCVNWRTFCAFVIPLKVPELIFIGIHYKFIIWPIALGSIIAFYLALKMGLLFSKSWEKSISLRYKNESLFKALTEEKDASNSANIAKSQFIATASHDLRQPMQAINIFIEMINPNALKETEKNIFKRMRTSIDVLNKMFNTLLDISKLDSNSVIVSEKEFYIRDLISEIAETLSPLTNQKNLPLLINGENLLVSGDRDLLNQVLRNLLLNAIQYTDQGKIEITILNNNDRLCIEIKDTGRGISNEDLPQIHKEFFRSKTTRSQHDGLGLGLSIVHRIIKIIGGELNVSSELGQGTTFTVNTTYPILIDQVLGSEKNTIPLTNQDSNTQFIEISEHADFNSRHLGLIENDPSLLKAYQLYFENCGFKVHIIPLKEDDFQKELLNLSHLDFILSDYRLEDKDGIYYIQRLREEFAIDIPACILTADTSPQHLNLFNQLNIQVLYKPIEVSKITEFIFKQLNTA